MPKKKLSYRDAMDKRLKAPTRKLQKAAMAYCDDGDWEQLQNAAEAYGQAVWDAAIALAE